MSTQVKQPAKPAAYSRYDEKEDVGLRAVATWHQRDTFLRIAENGCLAISFRQKKALAREFPDAAKCLNAAYNGQRAKAQLLLAGVRRDVDVFVATATPVLSGT